MLTLGIALFTLLIPGTTMGKLITKFELNRPSILDRLGQALAILTAKQTAFAEAKKLQNDPYFLSDTSDRFVRQCQQEVELANKSLSDLRQQLNLSTIEAEQLVWLKAVEIEQQVYQELRDRGFISNTVLAQLTLMLNLKSDTVQAGNIPPELADVRPLEIRLNNLLLQLFKNTSLAKSIQTNLVTTEYEYLTFMAYGCEQVSLRLSNLIKDSGIPKSRISECIDRYAKVQQAKTQEAKAIAEKYLEFATLSQAKILERVGCMVQNDTIKKLVKQGANRSIYCISTH